MINVKMYQLYTKLDFSVIYMKERKGFLKFHVFTC